MILSNLYGGWCDFDLDDFKGRCSYIKYVPFDVLEGVLDYIKYKRCMISFDQEGSDFYLIADDYFGEVFVVIDDEIEKEIIHINKSPEVVMAGLYHDIADHIEDWVTWIADTQRDAVYVRKTIQKLLEEINDARRNNKK